MRNEEIKALKQNCTDGWMGTTVMGSGHVIFLGLSDVNVDASMNSIDYAIMFNNNTSMFVYENGVRIGYYGEYEVGWIFRLILPP